MNIDWSTIERAARIAEREAKTFELYDGLSTRARRCLYLNDLRTKESIKEAFESGQIKRVRDLGKKTYREIALWMGIEMPSRCPFCGSLRSGIIVNGTNETG